MHYPWQEGTTMPYANHRGVHIHYQVEGDGPPVVLQHGSTARIERWYQHGYVEALKPHYQLILVDARGHGASDKPHDRAAYALSYRVGDIVAVLDDLGIQRAHYHGYSMGGWIGFGIAKHAADRVHSLILGGAHPYAERAEPFHHVDGTDPEAFITALEQFVGMRFTPEIKAQMMENDLQALAAAMHDRESLVEVLPTMTMPCLLFVGEADPRFPKVQECVQSMPHAKFVSLPDLNHTQAHMRSDLVLPHMMPFLQQVSQEATTRQ
jgi:pimeloyl-ACP methyl ester carboxylesterase